MGWLPGVARVAAQPAALCLLLQTPYGEAEQECQMAAWASAEGCARDFDRLPQRILAPSQSVLCVPQWNAAVADPAVVAAVGAAAAVVATVAISALQAAAEPAPALLAAAAPKAGAVAQVLSSCAALGAACAVLQPA